MASSQNLYIQIHSGDFQTQAVNVSSPHASFTFPNEVNLDLNLVNKRLHFLSQCSSAGVILDLNYGHEREINY